MERIGTNKAFVFLAIILVAIVQFSMSSAYTKNINYNIHTEQGKAKFVVQTLKYEPYPVAAGDWFDLWVKVQNIGSDDAQNAQFKLVPKYPFFSNISLIRTYGIVPGTFSAFRDKQLGDTKIQSNQIVMKFRVKVADNAPAGKNLIEIQTQTGDSGNKFSYNLPIEIAKSKVNFDVTMQNEDSGSLFTITNAGETVATNIIIKINSSEWNSDYGKSSINLGRISPGEFTQFSIQGTPKVREAHFNISYTDIGGTRRNVIADTPTIKKAQQKFSGGKIPAYTAWIFGLIGILIGILIMIFSRKIHKNKN